MRRKYLIVLVIFIMNITACNLKVYRSAWVEPELSNNFYMLIPISSIGQKSMYINATNIKYFGYGTNYGLVEYRIDYKYPIEFESIYGDWLIDSCQYFVTKKNITNISSVDFPSPILIQFLSTSLYCNWIQFFQNTNIIEYAFFNNIQQITNPIGALYITNRIQFYQNGNIKNLRIIPQTIKLKNDVYDVSGEITFYSSGALENIYLSYYKNNNVYVNGILINSISFNEDGSINYYGISKKTTINTFDGCYNGQGIRFYENGNVKELWDDDSYSIGYYNITNLLKVVEINSIGFYSNGNIRYVAIAGESIIVKRKRALYVEYTCVGWDENGNYIGRVNYDMNTGDTTKMGWVKRIFKALHYKLYNINEYLHGYS